MVKIINKSSTGKTTELLKLAGKDKKALVICKNPEHMREKANYQLPLEDSKNIAFISYTDALICSDVDQYNVYIDEIELFVSTILTTSKAFTMTVEDLGFVLKSAVDNAKAVTLAE